MRTFLEFVDKKERDVIHHLKVLKKLLEHNGHKVESFLSRENDPYIFLYADNKDLSFDGVRIYQLGETMAFRIQKEKDTHPYGTAYPLDVEGMFNDWISDNGDEKKAGTKVIESVLHEFKRFFRNSLLAERQLKTIELEKSTGSDGAGKILVKNNLLDYGNMIGNKVN